MVVNVLRRFWKQVLVVLALLVAFLYGKGCRHSGSTVPTATAVLKQDEVKRITVRNEHVRILTPTHEEELHGVRHVEITENKNGEVGFSVETHGWVFEPGFAAFATNGGGRIGLDACVFYWRRVDLLAGVGFGSGGLRSVVGYTALGYTPPIELLSNTDFFAGVGTNRSLVAGIRVAF